jgi:succinate dehydrogenase / fumarate reductase membrane anchor subunit
MSLRTPLGRVRGLGSAKEGVSHWWVQRVTAVALVPLVLWFTVSMLSIVRADYDSAVHWVGQPFNTVLLVALLVGAFYHALLGLQVVIEDYVHAEGTKVMALLIMKFIMVLLGASAILAVLRIAFGG